MEVNPNFSVDCVIFGYDFQHLNVLLVERTYKSSDPAIADYTDFTLTGNHIYEHEDLEEAARRILYNLTGIKDIYLEQFLALGHPDRLKKPYDRLWMESIGLDPDNRVLTVAYYSLLNCNETEIITRDRVVRWVPIENIGELAYDHNIILAKALEYLREKMRNSPIAYELLPHKFTLSQLQSLYETIYDTTLDKRNFRKKIRMLKYLIPMNEKQVGVAHKPARLYTFNREIYEITQKDLFDISM
jgi:hypothetical protein